MKNSLGFFFLLISTLTYSQYQMNLVTRQSPDRTISQKIGFTEIALSYGSPIVKNRTIWGDLVPYDKVWRAGANWATTISFSEPVIINDQPILKGTYSLFVLPKASQKWVLILNAVHRQWGAFKYDVTKDVVRIEVLPQAIPYQEKLLYEIDNESSQLAIVKLKWDTIALTFPIEIDMVQPLDSLLIKKSTTLANDLKWVAYLQAAELLLQDNQGLTTALVWIEQSEILSKLEMDWNPQYYPKDYILGHLYWTKARIHGELGNEKAALLAVEQMKNIEKPVFYEKEAVSEDMDKWINTWQKIDSKGKK